MTTSVTRSKGLRRLRWLPVVVVAAVALSACGGGSDDGDSGSSDAKKITFWLSTAAQLDGYTDLAKEFQAKEGIEVEIVNQPYDGYQDKLRQSAQANSLPDAASVPSLDNIWLNQLQDLSATANNDTNKIRKDLVTEQDGKVLYILDLHNRQGTNLDGHR